MPEIKLTKDEIDFLTGFREEMKKVLRIVSELIIGQTELKESVLIALLSGGHLLIEGMPGLGKTMTVKVFAKALNLRSTRVQFTPDLLPLDLTGTDIPVNIFEGKFQFRPGPIFNTDIFFGDEINRTPRGTQAALLEAMQEKQATILGITRITRPVSPLFFVLATINPLEIGGRGTYALPEAQIDRFLMKVILNYPSLDEECKIMVQNMNFEQQLAAIEPISSWEKVFKARQLIPRIAPLAEDHPIIRYIARIVQETRLPSEEKTIEETAEKIEIGASTRACIDALRAAVALAYLRDLPLESSLIQELMPGILRHRLVLSTDSEIAGANPDEIISDILKKVPIVEE